MTDHSTSHAAAIVPRRYDLAFEGRTVTAYVFRDRLTWVAAGVGAALDYADDGKTLPAIIRKAWDEEMVEGVDFDVLTGRDLNDFKSMLEAAEQNSAGRSAGRASSLMVLYETGLDLVCLKTEKPLGKKLRRMIAEEILPRLRRGEAIVPGAMPAPAVSDPTREMEARARLMEAGRAAVAMLSPAVSPEAKDAFLANVMAAATGMRVVPLLPAMPDGQWKRPSEIATMCGVTSHAVGRAITALGLRGNAEHCKTIMDQKKGSDGQVACYLYDEHAVGLIREHLASKSKAAA